MRRHLIAVVMLSLQIGWSGSALAADGGQPPGDNRGWTDGSGVGAAAKTSTSVSEPAPSGGAAPATLPLCTYHDVSPQDSATADQMAASGFGADKGTGPGKWVRKSCFVGDRIISMMEWSATRAPGDPVQLAQQALNYTALAVPALGMNPAADRYQLVNVPTWLWIDPAAWRPVSANASAGGVTVTTTATPRTVVWDPGDGGGPVNCDGPGVPYNPSDPSATPTCSYTYRRPTGRAVVTATVEWSVWWTSTSGGTGDLGVVRRSSSVPVRVAESQAINVSAAGRPS